MEKEHFLSDDEVTLFEKINNGDIEGVKALLTQGHVRINCVDDHGMSPVQHAAYKGDYDLCKLLIDCGADINMCYHDHKYTTLMFACLSGSVRVVSLLLESGISVSAVNSINRTASQLAAFVGNHDIVSIINNYVPVEEIEWYATLHDKEKEPKLPAELVKPFHRLVIITSVNPVRLAMFFHSYPILLEEGKKVSHVLNHLSGVKLNDAGNEMMSLKLHHFSFVVRECEKYMISQKKNLNKSEQLPPRFLERLIKHWIKDHKKSVPIALEKLMRQSIREYPFLECVLLQQFVRNLASVEVGAEPSALTLFTQAVSGQRDFDNLGCGTCGELNAGKKCSACKSIQYCDKYCQKLHWFVHKSDCSLLAKQRLMCEKDCSSSSSSSISSISTREVEDKLTNTYLNDQSDHQSY